MGQGSGSGHAVSRALEPVADETYGPAAPSAIEPDGTIDFPLDDANPGDALEAMSDVHEIVAELVDELSQASASGIGVLYRALDEIVESLGVDDAILVINEPGPGRQVFRAGRKPLENGAEELLEWGTGLYLEPEAPAFDDTLVVNLCLIALRLDLLRYDAWHDPLTGLYDRRSFDRLLENAVARSRRYSWRFTLVILDLDAFKTLNDLQGHAAGDDALRSLADRFRRVLRFGDDVARIGGDEFGLLLPNTDPGDVPGLLERVHAADPRGLTTPSFSFGLAVCPTETDDFDTLFRLADERLYEAKSRR
ncbi:MAG: GGDEF domain-containing protein [Acidimicrobiia bacterium]